MHLLGIIAEYNPFHLGHQYHLKQACHGQHVDGVVAVMSGNLTQRGEVAIFDKWTRAECALHQGIDLVLELPAAFATRSANYFALGGMLTLAATGQVSCFSCGIESQQPQQLLTLAQYLADEPPAYKAALQDYLKQGLSYPSAQQKALAQLDIPGHQELNQPNNLLALNYLQINASHQLNLQPLLISRCGDYHATAEVPGQFLSATAIRQLLLDADIHWQNHLAPEVLAVLQRQMKKGYHPLTNQDFAQAIFTLLRRTEPQELAQIIEISEGLEHRLYAMANQSASFAQLCEAVKSKRYTYTRIQRLLIHLLLGYTKNLEYTKPAYLRVLGFTPRGQEILKAMKNTATLPILTRVATDGQKLDAYGQSMLALDIRATDLYYLGYHEPALGQGGLDYLHSPVMVTPK